MAPCRTGRAFGLLMRLGLSVSSMALLATCRALRSAAASPDHRTSGLGPLPARSAGMGWGWGAHSHWTSVSRQDRGFSGGLGCFLWGSR